MPADVDARLAHVLEELHRDEVTCCSHVLAGQRPVVCALHPAAGLTCAECAALHLQRSDEHARPCDACLLEPIAESIPSHVTFGTEPAPASVYIRTPSGEGALLVGELIIWALVGLCERCHADWPSVA